MKKLIYILIPILLISTCYYYKHKEDIPFDSEKWKNWVEEETNFNMRKYMLNSLESQYDLIGMSKQEIIELLGESPSSYGGNYSYFIGYGAGINTCTLGIEFDNTGVVINYWMHEG